jgi:hypothetical protein
MFEKGQVGRIRTEFMRKDDVIAALQAENERLRKDANELADNLEKAAGNTASHYNCLIKWRAAKGVQS